MEPLVIATNGSVAAIDPSSGVVLWQTRLDTGALISATSGQDVAVLVRGGSVFAGAAGHLFCLDAQNGSILWHNPLKGMGHNDISMAIEGVAVQYLQKVVRQAST
jgi:outer membrane protein assembly factor BamB